MDSDSFVPNTICGFPPNVVKFMLSENPLIIGQPLLSFPYINVWESSEGNFEVEVAKGAKIYSEMVIFLTIEERDAIIAKDVFTKKEFIALCYSVLTSRTEFKILADVKKKFGFPGNDDVVNIAFLSHLVWLLTHSFSDILNDPVFCQVVWSLELFDEDVQLKLIQALSAGSYADDESPLVISYRHQFKELFAHPRVWPNPMDTLVFAIETTTNKMTIML